MGRGGNGSRMRMLTDAGQMLRQKKWEKVGKNYRLPMNRPSWPPSPPPQPLPPLSSREQDRHHCHLGSRTRGPVAPASGDLIIRETMTTIAAAAEAAASNREASNSTLRVAGDRPIK